MLIFYLIFVTIFCFMLPLGCISVHFSTIVFIGLSSDVMACSFSLMLNFISGAVLVWSYYYIDLEIYFGRFFALILGFLFSMFLLIFASRLITLFVGWDLLGFTSFFLVSYYGNQRRHFASLLTALSNRIGDIFIFFVFSAFFIDGSCTIFSMGVCFLLIGMTKSAQLPFSAWLPAAISAPTPVSALVHSSTLVTAGVYLLLRFSRYSLGLMLAVGVLTSLFAGVAACFEVDVKKIIALSTLSQLGIIITGLGLGFKSLTFNHLQTHAVVKAQLFVCLGSLIHSNFGSQELRSCLGLSTRSVFTIVCFIAGVLRLGGITFSSCYYTKDRLLEAGYLGSWTALALWLFYFSLGLTVCYLARVSLTIFIPSYNCSNLTLFVGKSWVLFFSIAILLLNIFFLTVNIGACSNPVFCVSGLREKILLYCVLGVGVALGAILVRIKIIILHPILMLSCSTPGLLYLLPSNSRLIALEVGGLQAFGSSIMYSGLVASTVRRYFNNKLLLLLCLIFFWC